MTASLAAPVQQASSSVSSSQAVVDAEGIASVAVECLLLELETWPKPGLVSHVDTGSHGDMDANTFRTSAAAIRPFFAELVKAGAEGCGMNHLRIIGLKAEAAMFAATSGVNTHRGAIFGLGLLCAAAGTREAGLVDLRPSLGSIVSRRWGADILSGPVLLHSHGARARHRYGAGGARMEAVRGYPSVYDIGLPGLRWGAVSTPGDAEAHRVHACFSLVAELEDTNLLHRGGKDGLRFARSAARHFLETGSVSRPGWRDRARLVHESFVARGLSPGGSADVLAMSLFVENYERRY